MTFANTEREQRRRFAQDTAKKMKLEVGFALDLRRLFKRIGDAFEAQYTLNGTIIRVEDFLLDMVALLRVNSRKTANAFSKTIRDEKFSYIMMESKQDAITSEVETLINEFIRTHSQEQGVLIINTTQLDLNQLVEDVLMESVEEGVVFDNEETAERVKRLFRQITVPRSENIAQTETQNTAERTKFIEADTVSGTVIAGETVIINKRWNATLDARTRTAHVIADSQVVGTDEPFIVGGERLMHPGDTSLGASAGNTIRCRCATSFEPV